MIDAKWKQIESEYGVGRSSLVAGVITMDFMEKND
jgi:hypothetical protein